MNKQFVVKGPLVLVLLVLWAVVSWLNIHDYAAADLAGAYAGKVVAEGTDYHPFGTPRRHRYILIEDSLGKRTKRYVDENGYLSVKVGEYVVKRAGLGQIPRVPGSPLP
jgi:hypothetical protein